MFLTSSRVLAMPAIVALLGWARSVVVHALATDHHTGLAGARLACLPVVW